MTDLDLQQQLCDRLANTAESESIRTLDDDVVMVPVLSVIPTDAHEPHKVLSLARVNTYVHRAEVGKTNIDEVIVLPTFARHWVVVVTEPNRNTHGIGYHLTFRDAKDARRFSILKPGSKGVMFTSYFLHMIRRRICA